RDLCIHELFEAQVRRDPEATAVVFEKKEMSYRELNGRANQLARYLRELGVGPETRVGVCMERSFEMVIGLLGTLKAGGAYVPLDANYPEERLGYMVRDAEVGVLLTEEKFLGRAPETSARKVCLDSEWELIASREEGNQNNETLPENLAYVIYTSGST